VGTGTSNTNGTYGFWGLPTDGTNNTQMGNSGNTGGGWLVNAKGRGWNDMRYYALSEEVTVTAIPEPSTLGLAAFGLLGLIGLGRRRVVGRDGPAGRNRNTALT